MNFYTQLYIHLESYIWFLDSHLGGIQRQSAAFASFMPGTIIFGCKKNYLPKNSVSVLIVFVGQNTKCICLMFWNLCLV